MKRRQLDALKALGIKTERYHLPAWPPVWGITLDGPRGYAVVEHTGRQNGGDNLYHLRFAKGSKQEWGAYRRQKDAIAAYIQRLYQISMNERW